MCPIPTFRCFRGNSPGGHLYYCLFPIPTEEILLNDNLEQQEACGKAARA